MFHGSSPAMFFFVGVVWMASSDFHIGVFSQASLYVSSFSRSFQLRNQSTKVEIRLAHDLPFGGLHREDWHARQCYEREEYPHDDKFFVHHQTLGQHGWDMGSGLFQNTNWDLECGLSILYNG